ncbi:MAG TPA: hypothetical protein VNT54_15220, partial [Solirubrobacteraceae bacterium]|nr:hypothetical protein [Solirubrobacteraceae bacterium]
MRSSRVHPRTARTLLIAVALALLAVLPAAHAVVRDGTGRSDGLTGTNTRDLLRGNHGNDTLRGKAGH